MNATLTVRLWIAQAPSGSTTSGNVTRLSPRVRSEGPSPPNQAAKTTAKKKVTSGNWFPSTGTSARRAATASTLTSTATL